MLLRDPAALKDYTERYGEGLAEAVGNVHGDRLDFLKQLPDHLDLEIAGSRFHLCHGAPWSMTEYVYPDSPLEKLERCRIDGVDNLLLGHTHYPMTLRLGACLVLNPGSVGQARDLGGLASWLLFDTNNRVFANRRSPYPVSDLIAEVKRRDPHLPKLWQLLLRGQPQASSA